MEDESVKECGRIIMGVINLGAILEYGNTSSIVINALLCGYMEENTNTRLVL